ncbi:hypothetical protein, partial [Paenibacillus forsythiae]
MPSIPALDDAGWAKLVQDMAYYFDDLTLKRGFQYYKQRRVSGLTAPSPGLVSAFVDGTKRYSVEIVLGALSIGGCNCPVAGPCKHMAAVLMDFAGAQGRPVQLLANAKASTRVRAEAASARAVPETGRAAGGRPGGQDALKERGRLIPAMNVAEWHELFARCVSPLAGSIRNPQYADEALTAMLRIKPPMAPELEHLYGLHARLFVLETLLPRAAGKAGGFTPSLGYYTHLAVTELRDDIERCFHAEPSPASDPGQRNRILDTLGLLRQALLAESGGHVFYSDLYYLLWRMWIIPEMYDQALFKEELRLLEEESDSRTASSSRQPLLIARAWMHFCMSGDDKALVLLREASEQPGFYPERLDMF